MPRGTTRHRDTHTVEQRLAFLLDLRTPHGHVVLRALTQRYHSQVPNVRRHLREQVPEVCNRSQSIITLSKRERETEREKGTGPRNLQQTRITATEQGRERERRRRRKRQTEGKREKQTNRWTGRERTTRKLTEAVCM